MNQMEQPIEYTNRELGIILLGIKDDLKKFADANTSDHAAICAKQDHTNGDIKNLKIWKARIMGGMAVIVFFVGLLAAYIKEMG